MMRRLTTLLILLSGICLMESVASVPVFEETFVNVDGNENASSLIDQTKFDNPGGWEFENAFAGPESVIIMKGGSFTIPLISGLNGNASFFFSVGPWENPNGSTPVIWENLKPNKLSVVGSGELNTYEYDELVSVSSYLIYDIGPDTRVKFTADHDIRLTGVSIYYGDIVRAKKNEDNITGYSHHPDDFYNPIDIVLTPSKNRASYLDDGEHNILVYTLDGTEPTRTSTRYDGNPIRISETTTLQTATILGNGSFYIDTPQVYNFPVPGCEYKPEIIHEINNTPGNLKSLLTDIDADVVEGVKITGKINGVDLAYLVSAEGRVANLKYVDLEDIILEYDGTKYRTVVNAPEAGMGTVYTSYYILGEENYDEGLRGSPTAVNTNCYRNNLAAAFYQHPSLKTVILPAFLEDLGEMAFADCRELANVKFFDKVKSIGSSAFARDSKLELYDFPSSVEKIGNYAFTHTILGNLKLERKVELGYGVFEQSTVERVEIPFPGDSIPDYSFADCPKLKELVVGEGVIYIGEGTFANSPLVNVILPESLEEISSSAFDGCPFVKDIVPEDGIRYIGRVAFQLADRNLPEYTIKDGMVSIGDFLFASTKASGFNIPSSVEIIGKGAFSNTAITRLPVMQGVKRINREAFSYCNNLSKVIVPESVEYMNDPFKGCNALWSITYNAVNAECEGSIAPRELEEIIIGDKVKKVPRNLFSSNGSITEVKLPESVEIIDPHAFESCTNLKRVAIPGKITSLGEGAFNNCASLEYIANLDVVEIPDNAFCNCSSLKGISLSDRTERIGYRAFSNCVSLEDFYWPLSLKRVENAFDNCKKLTVVSLPEGTLNVWSPFYGCTSIKRIYVPSTVLIGEDDPYFGLTLDSNNNDLVITCMLLTPPDIKGFGWNNAACIKVPAESLDAYSQSPEWKNFADKLQPVGELKKTLKESITDFGTIITEETDLSDTMMENLYLTLADDDEYDAEEGALVLNSTMDDDRMDDIGRMAPGKSDIANRFNGIVVSVSSGVGSVTIDCVTSGSRKLSVKVGDGEPVHYSISAKGEIKVEYNVSDDTFIYIYAAENNHVASSPDTVRTVKATSGDCVKLYSIKVKPLSTSIEDFEVEQGSSSTDEEYFTLKGIRIDRPAEKGLYIVRRSDGTSSVIMKK